MNQFEEDVSQMFARLPIPIQDRIVERVTGIVARASVKTAILGIEDLVILTGRSRRFVTRLVNSRQFPACVYLMDESPRKGWMTKDVMQYFESRRRPW